jgi:hypothetical protein
MAGKWLKSSRLAGKPFFHHYSGTLSGANGFNTPSPLFQQKGWNPMTPAIDPSGGTTIPFRLDTAPGPLLDGDCVNDPRPRLDHAPRGMQQRSGWRTGPRLDPQTMPTQETAPARGARMVSAEAPGWPGAGRGPGRALTCAGTEACRRSLTAERFTERTVWELVASKGREIGKFQILSPGLAYDAKYSAATSSPPSTSSRCTGSVAEGGSVLLPLGSPLPDDSVVAARAKSGLLGGLTVPLSWGVAVPPDDYDHWAPEPGEGADAEVKAAVEVDPNTEDPAEGTDEWNEWSEWAEWQAEAEPRFELPRSSSVVPHSPAAG